MTHKANANAVDPTNPSVDQDPSVLPARLTRRYFLQASTFTAAATWLGANHVDQLFAQQAQPTSAVAAMRAAGATAKITVQPLRRNVSVLMGSGGNIAVLPGPDGKGKSDGKLLVDSGYATSRPQISQALDGISGDPLKHLIDSHWHFDHTDGNEWIHSVGATIIAHENTKKRLSTTQEIPAFGATFPPAPAGALPTLTFSTDHTLHTNGETLKLAHYSPAHTDGDIYVQFVDANILHTGDTWFNGLYPFIDYDSGGTVDGMIAAAARTLASVDNDTIIIPGHGPTGNKAQLSDFRDMLIAVRDRIAKLKKDGKSLDDVIAAAPTADYDAKYGHGLITPPFFVRVMYAGV